MTVNDQGLLQKAVDTFGEISQRDMAIEECSELIKALCKFKRQISEASLAAVIEETVDVSLAAEQMRMIFDHDGEFQRIRLKKLDRLARRIAAKNINL
jgi:hypothetical protein